MVESLRADDTQRAGAATGSAEIGATRPPRAGAVRSQPASALPLSPYPGLRPFEEDEWPIFFGREKITHQIVERLTSNQIVVIHGSSGCGKSSFVRAGVLARLARECAREGLEWRTATMRPGNSPLWNLAIAIAGSGCKAGEAPALDRIRAIRQHLNVGGDAFLNLAKELGLGPERQVCILVDQFEELFRFAREIGNDEAELFGDIICGFGKQPPDGLHLIITVRSDHLGDCAQFHGLAEVVNRNQYLLPRLEDEDLIRAIRDPATLYKGEVKLDLAMRLLRDSEGEIDALPLIQHCLMRMWQEAEADDRIVDLPEYKGLRQGLSNHADEIFDTIVNDSSLKPSGPAMESAIQALFSALTAVDGNGRYIRRPQTFAQLCDVSGLDGKTLNEVLRPFRLRSAGFLMPQGTQDLQGEDIVDISHEALIRHWGKLAGSLSQAGWIQSEAEDGQRYRALLDMIPDTLPSRKHMEWWKVRPRTAQWATRYGGKFGEVQELLARAKRRQGLIRVLGTLLLLFIPAIIGTAFYWQQVESRRKLQADANQALDDLLQELKSAQTARAISLASIGEQLLNRDGATRGLLVALEGLKGAGEPSNPNSLTDLPILPQTRRLAYRALQELRETYINPGPRFIPPQVSFVPETSLLVIGRSGSPLQFMDAKTGKIVAHADSSDLSSLISTKWVIGKDGLRLYLLGQDREQKNSVFSLDPCATQIASALSVCANAMPTRPAISKIMEIDQFPRAVSPDGRLVLTGGFGGQETRLWDLQEKRRIDVPLPTSFNAVFNSDFERFRPRLGRRHPGLQYEGLFPLRSHSGRNEPAGVETFRLRVRSKGHGRRGQALYGDAWACAPMGSRHEIGPAAPRTRLGNAARRLQPERRKHCGDARQRSDPGLAADLGQTRELPAQGPCRIRLLARLQHGRPDDRIGLERRHRARLAPPRRSRSRNCDGRTTARRDLAGPDRQRAHPQRSRRNSQRSERVRDRTFRVPERDAAEVADLWVHHGRRDRGQR